MRKAIASNANRRIKYANAILLSTLCMAVFSPSINAQGGGIRNDTALRSDGKPAVGATVRICTEAAAGIPCSPTASIFTNKALTVAKTNPFGVDSVGAYSYYAAPGFYQEQLCLGSACVTNVIQISIDGSAVIGPFLPIATGEDLGSTTKRWDVFAQNLNVAGTVTGLTGFVPTTRILTAGTGLTGGGDLTADRSFAVATNGITNALFRQSGATSVVGRSAGSTGDVADIAASANGEYLRRAAGALSFGVPLQIWRIGFHQDTTPTTGEKLIPLPMPSLCASSITVQKVSVTALTKGSGTMTFNVVRYSAAGVSQGNVFGSSQTYSNTGDNRQDFTVTTTTAAATDYFRFNFVTVNAQDDLTIVVEGQCELL